MKEKTYLGDSVYAQYVEEMPDMLMLTTENGIEVSNTIYLEPQVIEALLEFLRYAR